MGVALGGSLSALIAQRFNWRAAFWILGGIGIVLALPLSRFFQRLPETFTYIKPGPKVDLKSFLLLFKVPTLCIITFAITVSTFGLFLVYTWLPTFLYDKFQIGLARAGFEASIYPQLATGCGLLLGGWLADHYNSRFKASRFWVIITALLLAGAPLYMFLLGWTRTLGQARLAAMAFGFFAGFITGNQASATFDVVPVRLRASAIGVLNLVAALVSGFAPFLGGLARNTIGVNRLMSYTAATYTLTGLILLYGTLRHFERDKIND